MTGPRQLLQSHRRITRADLGGQFLERIGGRVQIGLDDPANVVVDFAEVAIDVAGVLAHVRGQMAAHRGGVCRHRLDR